MPSVFDFLVFVPFFDLSDDDLNFARLSKGSGISGYLNNPHRLSKAPVKWGIEVCSNNADNILAELKKIHGVIDALISGEQSLHDFVEIASEIAERLDCSPSN